MKALGLMVGLAAVLVMGGCHLGPAPLSAPEVHEPEKIPETIIADSEDLTKIQQQLQEGLQKKAERSIELAPVMPSYDPLADYIVSFSMVDEDFQVVLYSLSQAVGINFIMDPDVTASEKTLTLNFENVSAATVLREILNTYDLYYEIDQNVIRIKPYQEHIFQLNFLDTNLNTNFEIGGDVLGASETETASGLTGSFKLSGAGSRRGNAYDVIEDMVKRVLSPGGTFTLNRLSGSLYLRDTPAVIRSVSKLIGHFKSMLSRQIFIEARIIEVILSDEHRYGIDWSLIRNLDDAATELTSASWNMGDGLILSGTSGDFSLSAAIEALNIFGDVKIVSNPTIRSKHGKPAIISVGTSIAYKKSVETTILGTGDSRDTTTEVEVSTVFDGLILGVLPFIEEDGTITLLINPIKSDVDETSLEPEELGSGESITLPEVRIKELSTTISLHNGDVIILGGLIDKRLQRLNMGVPFLSALPIFGYLFKDEQTIDQIRELVIVLNVKLL